MTASLDSRRVAVDYAATLTAEEWQEFVRESRSTGCDAFEGAHMMRDRAGGIDGRN